MKQVEFTVQPPKFEVCYHNGKVIVRFYCDVQEEVREDDHLAYVCTCYEMETQHTENIVSRINGNYDAWLERAKDIDGGLNAIKTEMIAKSKDALAEYISTHPLTSYAHGGKIGVYSVTEEKQSLMTSQYISYQAEKAVNPDAKLTWNEAGKSCEEWTEEEFLQLVVEIKQYVYPLVSHQQKIEEAIAAANSMAELNAIDIRYDDVH